MLHKNTMLKQDKNLLLQAEIQLPMSSTCFW